MTERIFYASGITKHPPAPISTTLPDLPEPTVHASGRIAWPTILQYRVDGEIHDFPPTAKAIREPSRPSPIPAQVQLRTEAYSLIIHDLPRYERLKSEGWLRDPRHLGINT